MAVYIWCKFGGLRLIWCWLQWGCVYTQDIPYSLYTTAKVGSFDHIAPKGTRQFSSKSHDILNPHTTSWGKVSIPPRLYYIYACHTYNTYMYTYSITMSSCFDSCMHYTWNYAYYCIAYNLTVCYMLYPSQVVFEKIAYPVVPNILGSYHPISSHPHLFH